MTAPFDYTQYKTPYYEISVAKTPDGPFVKLPLQIARLMDKMEVVLTSGTTESCFHTTGTMSFSGGSREPFEAINTRNTSSLYGAGDITNAVSMIADLKFSYGSGGISFSSLSDQSATAISAVKDTLNLISGQSATKTDITKSEGKKGGGYLFDEGNAVKLTWGYKENPLEIKTLILTITMVQMDYPENDQSRLTIICQGGDIHADKLSPTEGQNYYLKLPAGLDPIAGVASSYKGLSTQQVIQKIAKDAGFDLILSSELTASVPEKDVFISWPAGMSLLEFLRDLGYRHNAIVSIDYNPKTGKPTIKFISRLDYYGQQILPDALFHFKRAGSIIKSINIRADYGSATGAGKVGMTSAGKVVGAINEVPSPDHIALAEGEGLLDTTASTKKQSVFNNLSNNISNNTVIGKVGYSPEADKVANLKHVASSESNCSYRKVVNLEFTSLGHPLLRPGVIKIDGIGQRYSNTYRLMVVTHTFDSNGYICRANAVTHSVAADGGIKSKTSTIRKAKDTQDKIQMSNAQAALGTISNTLTAYVPVDVEAPVSGPNSGVIDKNSNFDDGSGASEPVPITGVS